MNLLDVQSCTRSNTGVSGQNLVRERQLILDVTATVLDKTNDVHHRIIIIASRDKSMALVSSIAQFSAIPMSKISVSMRLVYYVNEYLNAKVCVS